MKKYAKAVLIFIVTIHTIAFISGCARKFRPITIEIPPNRVGIGGELDERQQQVLYNTLGILMQRPYKEHHYTHQMGGSLSHSINVEENYSSGSSITVDPRAVKP